MTDYWWKRSDPPKSTDAREVVVADSAGLEDVILYLKRNIGQKPLVDANFRSFEQFAQDLSSRGIQLIVLEGHVHPDARKAYDTSGMQSATRQRLYEMAHAHGFQFFDKSVQPSFSPTDFVDATHLNSSGRFKLTEFLLSCLKERRATSDETRE
jgi:hypothetical protein